MVAARRYDQTAPGPVHLVPGSNAVGQGGYPVYVVNATTVAQVQAAVNFARNTGVRLVVKNTGHDFAGKSLGSGALSIWRHALNEMEFHANYTFDGGYAGPAFKVGAGVQAADILKAPHDKG